MLQAEDRQVQEPSRTSQDRLRPLDAFCGSLANRVYLSLKDAISAIRYRPGEFIRKSELCDAFGVSRSPVAEAVSRLSAEGLVNVIPQTGTFVAHFSMTEIRAGAFLREAIELAAVERVAQTVTDTQLTELQRNLRVQEALVADGDDAGFYRFDSEMHEMILSFTGYRRLAQVSETAWLHVSRARQLVMPIAGRIAATLAEHRAIIDALEMRDPVAARSATQFHLSQLLIYIEPLERKRPDLFGAT